MTAFEVFGVLKLEKKDYERGLKAAGQQARSALGKGLGTAAKVAGGAITAATGAVTAFGAASVSAATSYESAFTGVRKTVDATEDEFAQLSDWIMQASTKMASSKEDIAATMEIAGQLGVSGVEGLEKFTETMIMLGDTTNLNAEEAASALAKFGNIAGLAPENMDQIGSAIVDLGNHFATTEADIVNMSSRLASAGTIAGFSATDILALSTAMSSVGISAEAGGTAMSTIMTKIGRAVDEGIDPANEKLKLFADTAGMSMEEFATAWKSTPTVALQSFTKGLDGVVEAGGNVTAILDTLGIKGIRETNTIKSLALASDVLDSAVSTANRAFEENVALQNEANTRYGTTESQALQTAEAFKNLQVAIGEGLTPVYGELMSFSSAAMQAMTEGFQEGGFEGLMASFGTALSDALGMLVKSLPTIVEAGAELLGAFGQGLIDNAPIIRDKLTELLWMGVAALKEVDWSQVATDLVEGLSSAVESMSSMGRAATQILRLLAEGLVEAAPILWDALTSLVKDGMRDALHTIHELDGSEIGSDIASLFESALADSGEFIMIGFQIIDAVARLIGEALPELIPAAVAIIAGLAENLINPDNLNNLLDAALSIIQGLADGIIAAIPTLVETIPELLISIVDFLSNPENLTQIAETGGRIVGQLVMGLLAALPQLILGLAKLLVTIIGTMLNWPKLVLTMGGEIVNGFIDGVLGGVDGVGEAIGEIITTITDKIQEMVDGALQWGKDLIDNFVKGIGNFAGKVGDGISNVAQDVVDFIGFSEPKKGPLSRFHEFAPDMIDLFTQGIDDNIRKVEEASSDLASAMYPDKLDYTVATVDAKPKSGTDGGNSSVGAKIDKLIAAIEGQKDTVIPIYIGNKMIDELVLDANKRIRVKSGGFANV